MALVLREYQQDIITELRQRMLSGQRRILVCSPTGSGKTALTANMLGTAANKNMNSVFIVHRRELIKQSALAFDKSDVYHGIIANGFPSDSRALVQVASVQTLVRRYQKMPYPKLLIWDEVHHIAAGSWNKIFEAFPKAFHVGLTATPERLDGKGLDKWFTEMIKGPSVSWLIENEYLAPYRLYAPSNLSLEGVRTQMGDYKRSDLINVVDKPIITGSAVNEYRKVAYGKRAVVFCVSVKHSNHVVNEFNAAGIPALHVDGETPSEQRDHAIQLFSKGKIKILSNVDLFGEGFDMPNMEAVILLRPTQSLGLYLQQVGRALRTHADKDEAIILDHVGNYERHGLPDQDREWSLKGRGPKKKGNKQTGIGVKVCEQCFAAQLPGADKCKFCDFVFIKQTRSIEEVEGELIEVDPKIIQMKKKKEQAGAQTLEQLVEIGRQRGYKKPRGWAQHIFQARQRKKLGMG